MEKRAAVAEVIAAVGKLKTTNRVRGISTEKIIGFLHAGVVLQNLIETEGLLIRDQVGIDDKQGLGRFDDWQVESSSRSRIFVVVALLPEDDDFFNFVNINFIACGCVALSVNEWCGDGKQQDCNDTGIRNTQWRP